MSLKGTILNEIRNVAASQKMTLAPLTDDLSLQDSGLELALLCDTCGAPRGHYWPRSV